MGRERVVEGPLHRGNGGLVEHVLHTSHRLIEEDRVENAPFHEVDACPDCLQVCQGPGRQVVQDGDLILLGYESVDQVRPDEASATGDQDSSVHVGTMA